MTIKRQTIARYGASHESSTFIACAVTVIYRYNKLLADRITVALMLQCCVCPSVTYVYILWLNGASEEANRKMAYRESNGHVTDDVT